MALGKGIPVINGFDLNSKLPLDSRTVVDTKEEMNALVTNGSVGDGQLCYCKADKKLYVLKESVWSEVGGSGSKSVPPTLNWIDFDNGEIRTSITEEEYNNLKNGLYNQVIYTDDGNVSMYSPSKLFSMGGQYYFAQFKISMNEDETFSYSSMGVYAITIGDKNASNEYPITVTEAATIDSPSAGGSASIPTLETKRSYIDADNTVYSDADINLIKKQENNFINLPIGSGNNAVNTLCFVVKNQIDSSGNSYILTAVGGWVFTLISSMSSAPVFITWNANMTTKKLTTNQFIGLSYDNTSLYVQDNKIFLTDTFTTQDPVNILHTYYVFDTINGKPIIHSDTAVNNYNIPTITFED